MKEQPIDTRAWAEWFRIQTVNDPQLCALVDCCARFVRRMASSGQPSWLTLLGRTGTGKTHCGERIWSWAVSRFSWFGYDFMERKIYWPDFVSDLRAGTAFDELRDLKRWPVLFLDDIGAERDSTGFATEQLNALLGRRVGKWTIITSNLTLKQLAGIEPRIADRIIREPGNEYIEITSESYATRMLQKKG